MVRLVYSSEHVWLRVDGKVATLGITEHAQNALGSLMNVDLPSAGQTLKKDDGFGSLESVKVASEIIAPIDATILETNDDVFINPELINESPYELGWLLKLSLTPPQSLSHLMDEKEYAAFVGICGATGAGELSKER